MGRYRNNLKRPIAIRNQNRKLYIFSEGENTEPKYFKAYEREVDAAIIVVCEKDRGVPKTLLEHAKEKKEFIGKKSYKAENGDRDRVWIVFDQDDHDEIDRVIRECDANGIGYAHSNPCFEVWLILHHEDYDRDEHRHLTQKRCEQVCTGYDSKTRKIPDLNALMHKVKDAEKRAKALEVRRNSDGGRSPQTNVYKLIAEIRGDD